MADCGQQTDRPVYQKAPGARKDYGFDWVDWLAGDTLVASTWTLPTGLTSNLDSFTDTTSTIWLASGTLGKRYTVTNTITTALGRIEVKSFEIFCTV